MLSLFDQKLFWKALTEIGWFGLHEMVPVVEFSAAEAETTVGYRQTDLRDPE
ncbi:hypothetical protein C1752_01368 [Acaryochloris thomasi RCC1774]|uniref:Uncharacterized protein n=1 Tax=Acaryochloris thomasi RCC1774 TaxID=1764569 RepID=A0A2W1JTQ0_9CYAN|nr:hypothetical protein C1752_01368 [Acaryochloris thomasi RCC1774]